MRALTSGWSDGWIVIDASIRPTEGTRGGSSRGRAFCALSIAVGAPWVAQAVERELNARFGAVACAVQFRCSRSLDVRLKHRCCSYIFIYIFKNRKVTRRYTCRLITSANERLSSALKGGSNSNAKLLPSNVMLQLGVTSRYF